MSAAANIVVLGSLNADLVQRVERVPRPGETLRGENLETFVGGKGANQAFAASRMGARTAMIGQVGDDSLGKLLLDSLRSAGVDTAAVGLADRPTGAATILVLPSGENLIVISPGANATLSPELAVARLANLDGAGFLLCQLETPIETVEKALAFAKEKGVTTILDPAPARTLSRDVLGNVDLLTPNETEALTLLGAAGERIETVSQAEAEAAAKQLLGLGVGTVVLKLGPLGCLVAGSGFCEAIPGFAVEAVDTTAAGDTFNGALAVGLVEGKVLPEAARFANAAAALSTTRAGAQPSMPSREEVERCLRDAA